MPALTVVAALVALACRAGADRPVQIVATRNGFDPARVPATRGQPLTLVVTRTTDDTCAMEIVIPEAGIDAPLPLGKPVTVRFTPARTGELRYSCGMKMFQGVIDVR